MKYQIVIALLAWGLAGAARAENGAGGEQPPVFDQKQSGQGEQGGKGGPGGRPHHPPPEALAACKGKTAGVACSFTGRRGEAVSGTCFTPDSSKPLACKPSGPPPM